MLQGNDNFFRSGAPSSSFEEYDPELAAAIALSIEQAKLEEEMRKEKEVSTKDTNKPQKKEEEKKEEDYLLSLTNASRDPIVPIFLPAQND